MPPFKIISDLMPIGDQPQAVDRLVEGLERGYKHQTLERIGIAEEVGTEE